MKLREVKKIAKNGINLRIYVCSARTYSSQNRHKSKYVLQKTFINFEKIQFLSECNFVTTNIYYES